MSKNLNISVLVAARDEYIEQLKCILSPLIIQGINSIYQDAIDISEGKKIIYKFQELLKDVPKWNQTILQEESKRIKKKCSYIMDIVTAIFVSNVKILASIRLKGNKENIRVKIPTSDIFIHSIYIETAQQIFYDPMLFYHKNENIQKNKKQVGEIIRYSIDETIRQMLPFDNILQEYLANALNDNADNDSDSGSEESEVSDPDEESLHGDDLIESEEESDEEDPLETIKQINTSGNAIIPDLLPPPPPPQIIGLPLEQQQNTFQSFQQNTEIPYPPNSSDSISDSGSSSGSESSSGSDSGDEDVKKRHRDSSKHHRHHHSSNHDKESNNHHGNEKYSFF